MTFRQRLTLWSTLVAAVSIGVCAAVAAWYIQRRGLEEMDTSLRAETAHFFEELKSHGGARFNWTRISNEMKEWMPPRDPPRYMEVRTPHHLRWHSKNLPASGFPQHEDGVRELRMGEQKLRAYSEQRDRVTFTIARNLDEVARATRGLLMAALAGLPFALGFAWLGGRKLAAMAVAPVEKMTAAAEQVTAEQFHQRVPVPRVKDEMQRLAQVLNTTFDRLERSYQQALRFSADASHELKTPVTVLRTCIEATLGSATLNDNDRAAVSTLLEQTQRLSNIITSLLLLSRADAGRLTLDLTPQDLTILTQACVEDARIIAEERHVQVECSLPPTAPASVDALRYSQIASNLLDNAVKYNREGGSVEVSLADSDGVWRLSVANTGTEIKSEHREHLFERFFRAEHTVDQNGQGLGLSLSKELARAHGGDIRLVRSADGWTEFEVTLPHGDLSASDNFASRAQGDRSG
jgi:signal transduction histidine kinase